MSPSPAEPGAGAGAAGGAQPSLGRVAWDAWRAYSHRAGGYQAAGLLSAVYFLVLGPTVLLGRLFGNHLLDTDSRPRASYWIARPPADRRLERLERQF